MPGNSLRRNFICNIVFFALTNMAYESNLYGKHFVYSGINSPIIYNAKRNASGYIIQVDGITPFMMEWLAQRYKFTYSIFQSNETTLEASENKKGLIYYLLQDDYQLLFSVVPTNSRVAVLELSQPNIYIPVSYLIPKPKSSANIAAIAGSFEMGIWVWLIISMFFTSLGFCSLRRFTKITNEFEHLVRKKYPSWESISTYVVGVLLNQGGFLPLKTTPYYLIGGVWCIAAFVLVNAYSCTLISHVTLPIQKPLINSIYDLRDRPEVNLVTNKNLNTEVLLLSSETGLLKMLGDKLRSYPKSSCKTSKDCVELLKSGSNVYTSGVNSFLYGVMKDDYNTTGECHYLLQTNAYMNLPTSLALPKKTKYMQNLNVGIMQLHEFGLVDYWTAKYQPDPRQCLDKKNKHPLKSLKLSELSGVFIVLLIGFLVSFLVFIGEQILFHRFQLGPPRDDQSRKSALNKPQL